MKITSLLLFTVFITMNLYADKNWIAIEPIDKTKTSKQNTKLNVNLSQIEPIKKMIKNATVIKQLIDSSKKEKASTNNDKHWYALENMGNK